MSQNVICIAEGCRKKLTGRQRKFHSTTCQKRQFARDKRHNTKADIKPINIERKSDDGDYASVRRGQYYQAFVSEGIADQVATGDMTVADAASLLGCTSATVSRMLAAYKIDSRNSIAAEDWELSEEAKDALENFATFRQKYFRTELGKQYDTAPFHTNWINNIIDSIENGKELLILSPPRHGKTELLIHFAVYQICKNPNTRIMWVGGNEDIAKNALSAVLDVLDTNEELRDAYCMPGTSFKPDNRSGKNWSQNQFTVGTRTVAGIKSPTMVAVGKGGKILSRDCDIIIADDIEDHSSTMQPASRENTRNWWTTTLSSRKEEHTAMIVIGSRQHYDDLYSHLVDNESWKTLVEEAHDSGCTLPDWNEEEHVDCMLWAGKRTYKWLMDRKRAAETTGGRAIFEMVYLNVAMPDGLSLFSREEIEACRNQKRDIGQVPPGTRLIAGLDPASTGYQAAFLWAYDSAENTLHMVDMNNSLGGGIPQALDIIKEWWLKYNLSHWVIEENGFQKAIRQDRSIRDFASKHGVFLEGHETFKNKFDPLYGVTAMRPMFQEKNISLPYLSFEAQEKVNLYTSQLVYFSSAKNKSKTVGTKTDIVMASWFPMRAIRRMQKERFAELGYDYNPSFTGYETSNMDLDNWR
ncbi:MAG: hypothetical protein CMQ02_08900 [Gammaproteobacteria bacterium]|nr:hypothetical protein [Gammaproteobacteria bacterium]